MKKMTLEYDLPDVRFGTVSTLGKTSTQEYNGVESLVLWVNKSDGVIENSFDPENVSEQPLPLHLKQEVLLADTMENTIKIGLLFGGLEPTKFYEVSVGPSGQPNALVADPTDIRDVFSENDILEDYKKPLVFKTDLDRQEHGSLTWDFIRGQRNTRLDNSDAKLAIDMPESLKEEWVTYRNELRNMPDDWAGVPIEFIKFPISPAKDDTDNTLEEREGINIILISERSAQDELDVAQLGL